MGMSVQELKHAARLQEWSARVAECRSSGIGVKAWCAEHSIALKTYYNWEKQYNGSRKSDQEVHKRS